MRVKKDTPKAEIKANYFKLTWVLRGLRGCSDACLLPHSTL